MLLVFLNITSGGRESKSTVCVLLRSTIPLVVANPTAMSGKRTMAPMVGWLLTVNCVPLKVVY